jgi:hypothetical protein
VADGDRTVLFFRDYRRFHGGHLKVWDYFNHVLEADGYSPRIAFAPKTRWDEDNPWSASRDLAVADPAEVTPDVFFVAGRDWAALDEHPAHTDERPVLNLVQGLRHADPASTRFEYLGRKAIRICVSEEVATAVRETGATVGPIVVIPNGLDIASLPAPAAERPIDVLVVATKRQELGERLLSRLEAPGRRVEVLYEPLPRDGFLARLGESRVTLFLPLEEEGFYLPALEGLAMGTVVVCPDCLGNRSFCVPGQTAFRPPYDADAIVRAVEEALALGPAASEPLLENAREMAERHSLETERRAFTDLLQRTGELW